MKSRVMIHKYAYKPGKKKPHRLKVGMKVKIRGYVRILVIPIFDITGGWVVNKPIDGFKCWNEKDMTVVEK